MKSEQWTLPKNHRANKVISLYVFPLFILNRDKIDVLNDSQLDPLFELLNLIEVLPWPDSRVSLFSEEREKIANSYLAKVQTAQVLNLFILEKFGWPFTHVEKPSSFIAKNPIKMPKNGQEAVEIGRNDLYGIESKWRAFTWDAGILMGEPYCFEPGNGRELLLSLKGWEYIPDFSYQWTQYNLDENLKNDFDKKAIRQIKIISK